MVSHREHRGQREFLISDAWVRPLCIALMVVVVLLVIALVATRAQAQDGQDARTTANRLEAGATTGAVASAPSQLYLIGGDLADPQQRAAALGMARQCGAGLITLHRERWANASNYALKPGAKEFSDEVEAAGLLLGLHASPLIGPPTRTTNVAWPNGKVYRNLQGWTALPFTEQDRNLRACVEALQATRAKFFYFDDAEGLIPWPWDLLELCRALKKQPVNAHHGTVLAMERERQAFQFIRDQYGAQLPWGFASSSIRAAGESGQHVSSGLTRDWLGTDMRSLADLLKLDSDPRYDAHRVYLGWVPLAALRDSGNLLHLCAVAVARDWPVVLAASVADGQDPYWPAIAERLQAAEMARKAARVSRGN